MARAGTFGWAVVLLAASLWAGCGNARPAAENRVLGPAAARSLDAPLDIGAVMREVRLAFRADSPGFSIGQDTYGVRAAPDGGFELVGYRYAGPTTLPPSRRPLSPRVIEGRPLAVRTVSVTGVVAASIRPAKIMTGADGRLIMDRGPLREILGATEQGMEQSWHIAERPAGAQDLVIRVQLVGLPFVGKTQTGLHFTDPVSGLGVRYGNATWVDASGQRTAIELDFAGGELRLTVPRMVLEASSFPAALDPFLTPEFGMDNPTQGPSLRGYAAAGAFDGTNYLVVWEDSRQGLRHIYGTRVSAAGVVLDPAGIVIGSTTAEQGRPAVAYGGGSFLVAWEQNPSGSSGKVFANRVSKDGTVQDGAGLAVSGSAFGSELDPKIAFDGTNFMVVWAEGLSSGGQIAAERVSPAGARLDNTPVTVSRITSVFAEAQGTPSIAFDGTNYMVVWQDDRSGVSWDVYANRVSPAGMVQDANGLPIATADVGEEEPAIVFDGTNYLVVWSSWPSTGRDSSINGRRVSPAGTVLDATALPISVAAGEQSGPTVAFAGNTVLVAWSDYRGGPDSQIFSTRVGKDGTVLDPLGHLAAGATVLAYKPGLVAGAGQYLLAWSGTDVRAALLGADGSGQAGEGFALSSAPNTQQDPAVAFDGTNYLVVWSDSRTGGPGIFGTRVSRQGAVLDVTGIRVSPSPGEQSRPAVAWNGTHYLVVWFSYNQMKARRVAPDGSLPDAADISFPVPFAPSADVASNGSDFLVVGAPSVVYDIQAYRVSGAGVVLDSTAIPVSTATADQREARATFDGTNYLVVWTDGRAGGTRRTYGARVSAAGAVLDPNGIPLGTATGKEFHEAPHMASGGGSSMVVWKDALTGALGGSRVSAAGAVLAPPEIAVLTPTPTTDVVDEPRLTFDGTGFVLEWLDAKYSNSTLVSNTLYAAILGASGTPGPALSVTTDPKESRLAALASDGAGGTLIAYVVPSTTSGFPVPRVRARILFETAPAGSCVSASQCTTGFCVDGVCCNSVCGGGATNDCQACSVLAGAAVNGTCGPVSNGWACDDGNACTRSDTCAAGTCVGANAVVCTAQDSCHAASCTPSTGLCSNPVLANGAACPGGTCQTGTCLPAPDGGPEGGAVDAAGDTSADGSNPTDAAGATADQTADAGGDDGAGGDAGAGDAATGDATSTPADRGTQPAGSGCGCRLADSGRPRGMTLLLMLVGGLLARRRRKRGG